MNKKLFSTGNIAVMGVLSAVAYVLYLIPHFLPIFKLPFFPPWLDLQVSDLPALLGGFAINPVAGAIIIVVKCLLKMPFSSTACVGELADILVGIAFVVPASIVYHKVKSKKSAVTGMIIGTVMGVVISCLANYFVLVPFYVNAFGFDAILGMVTTLYPAVTQENFYLTYTLLGVIPFNLLRCVLCSVITYFVYKPLSKALHWEAKKNEK